ncbi:MAG: (deoxy)nucleoside triphosphate pyrophosphohydrolase [Oscillochloris sp.]|nr:(deoxy)nucleoside triphosphate pyrophosphohydrolase [Oscillochloris sp.]
MKRTIVVVAAVIRRDDGAVLLARRRPGGPDGGRWEFPGGKLEPGEQDEACLARELHEELGVTATIGALLAVGYGEYASFRIELRGYQARILAGEPQPHDHDELAWVQAADLRRYDLPAADIPLMRALEEGARQAEA